MGLLQSCFAVRPDKHSNSTDRWCGTGHADDPVTNDCPNTKDGPHPACEGKKVGQQYPPPAGNTEMRLGYTCQATNFLSIKDCWTCKEEDTECPQTPGCTAAKVNAHLLYCCQRSDDTKCLYCAK